MVRVYTSWYYQLCIALVGICMSMPLHAAPSRSAALVKAVTEYKNDKSPKNRDQLIAEYDKLVYPGATRADIGTFTNVLTKEKIDIEKLS